MINLTDPTQMLKQWSEIQETAFNNTLNSMEMFQNRAEKMVGQLWDQTAWASEKISDAMMGWGNACKTGCETLQKTMGPAWSMMPETDTPKTDTNAE